MRDILPVDQKLLQKVFNVCSNMAEFYGFQKIDTPILEQTELYSKGTGASTDIVQKQMYSLKTKGGDCLTLRPEFTPGIARAYIENGMQNFPQPVKLYSIGPLFRYEHPQAGRFRQFNQFNVEVFGEGNPVIDVQTIQLFYNALKELHLKNISIEINSIGDSKCRPYYKKLLANYFRSREAALCSDCRRRLRENPLRVLDCKEEKCQRLVNQAPQLIDHLCEECHRHFKGVLELFDEIELPYKLNPYLVRGLDYYTKTVFEIFIDDPKKEENEDPKPRIALAGGGRYDNLLKLYGGGEVRAFGGGLGIERVLSILKAKGVELQEQAVPKVFLAQIGDMARRKSLKLFEDFRKAKIHIAESFGKDSLKSQLRAADKDGVRYTLLIGQQEALNGTVIIRDMKNGSQEVVKLDKAVREIQKKLGK